MPQSNRRTVRSPRRLAEQGGPRGHRDLSGQTHIQIAPGTPYLAEFATLAYLLHGVTGSYWTEVYGVIAVCFPAFVVPLRRSLGSVPMLDAGAREGLVALSVAATDSADLVANFALLNRPL